jgi:hypothetical protein
MSIELKTILMCLILADGLLITFHRGYRKWTSTTRLARVAWFGISDQERRRFFQFMIGPAQIIISSAALYGIYKLSTF